MLGNVCGVLAVLAAGRRLLGDNVEQHHGLVDLRVHLAHLKHTENFKVGNTVRFSTEVTITYYAKLRCLFHRSISKAAVHVSKSHNWTGDGLSRYS